MNQLKLTLIPFTYPIDNQDYTIKIGEFLIDEKPLCDWLGIERDLGNCDTDLVGDKLYIGHFLRKLTGEAPPYNQLATPTVILYRCHCGCDDCGVVSAKIIITKTQVIWQNVGYEDDDDVEESEMDEFDKW